MGRRAQPSGSMVPLGGRAVLALIGLALLLAACLERFDAGWAPPIRWRLFDFYQRLVPRDASRLNAVVVGIDEEAIARYGPWPWPRSRVAELLERLAEARPAVIGLDVLFTAPDVNDPRQLASGSADLHGALLRGLRDRVPPAVLEAAVDGAARGLQSLPSTDEALEFALFAAPVVLARRAALEREVVALANLSATAGTAPHPVRIEGPGPGRQIANYQAAIPNLARFEAQARGLGFITAASADWDGVVRQVPLVVRVAGQVVPTLPVEMLRVALSERRQGNVEVILETDAAGARAVRIGPWRVPTDPAGRLRLYYGPAGQRVGGDARLTTIELSAATVLGAGQDAGAFRTDELRDALLLVGVTGLGRVDAVATPIASSTRGAYVHTETIENIIGGSWLQRPAWALWAEFALGLAGIAVIGWLAPRLGRLATGIAIVVVGATCAAVSFAAFLHARVLIAPLLPVLAVLIASAIVRGSMLAHTRRRARALELALQREQLDSARVAGELNAARAIQLGLLPNTGRIRALPGSLEVHAVLEPAREVGGDLYDVFMLDARRLFFVVGDVAGKGIPASLFMALGKTLCKSSALRSGLDLQALVATANLEIARDNPGEMFITALFGIIDAQSGELQYCNAGHDDPLVVGVDGAVRKLATRGGPPLCILDDFPYPTDTAVIAPGETVVVVTDGVTEAQDDNATLYGHARLERALAASAGQSPRAAVDALVGDVKRHAAGAEPYDDLTVLALRYGA